MSTDYKKAWEILKNLLADEIVVWKDNPYIKSDSVARATRVTTLSVLVSYMEDLEKEYSDAE